MADYCVTVAKLTKLAGEATAEPRIVAGLAEMGVRAEEMTRVALRSFQHRDLARAEALVGLDELIDRTNRRTVEHVLELEAEHRDWGLRMLVASRCLERIGDHAVDIGEQTAYLVTGEFREFTDASHPEAEELV
jgi:phosphate transport system protein